MKQALARINGEGALLIPVLLTLQALVINRLAGIEYPLWSPRQRLVGDEKQ